LLWKTGGAKILAFRRIIIRTLRPEDDSVEMGFINLRVGQGKNLIRYRGLIGYGVNPEYRGHGYAARACCLLLPLSRRHGLNPLWITCNPTTLPRTKPANAWERGWSKS
jgi:predicted acetyltransferase